MKYLCLVYCIPGAVGALSAAEREILDRQSREYDEKLMAEGVYLASSALQGVSTAKTIRVREGRITMVDGPFAETKEVLVGFIFIDAPDQAAAEAIAQGVPMARYGSIELRPELEF